MLKRNIVGIYLLLTLISCSNSRINLSNISSNSSKAPSSEYFSENIDGYVIPYNNTLTRLTTLKEDISDFVQHTTDNHYFIALDDTKIENLIDISYIVNGYFHTEKREKFSLQKIETRITLSINGLKQNIIIVSYGCNNSNQIDLSQKSDGFDIEVKNEIVGQVTTDLSFEYIQNLFEKSINYFAL